jgi:hypothetical protein
VSLLAKVRAYGVYGFPVPLLPPRTSMERLRRYAFSERVKRRSRLQKVLAYAMAWTAYPFFVAEEVLQNAKVARVRKRGSFPPAEMLRMYTLALLRNVPPVEYVYYGLEDPVRRVLSGEYLYWTDSYLLTRMNRLRGADNNDVQDKLRFAQLCEQHGLPHVAVLAACRFGQCVLGDLALTGETDLWVKPARSNASQGAMAWMVVDGNYRSAVGEVLTPQQWQQRVLQQDSIVQRRVLPDADLVSLTNGAVPVMRVNSVTAGDGSAQIIGAFLLLPHGNSRTTTGAVSCVLDLHTGRIDHSNQYGVPTAAHPDTGEVMVGRTLAAWAEVSSLVVRAHEAAFPKFASLGWDVAMTDRGPLLLETNSGWGAMDQQLFYGPLGQSALREAMESACAPRPVE